MKYDPDRIVLGTVQLGLMYGINNANGKPSLESSVAILQEAYQSGIRYLDTAEGYGDSQKVIGKYHNEFPNNTFGVITKLTSATLAEHNNIADVILENLSVLKLNSLEGYMFHNYKDFCTHRNLLKELSSLKERGIIRNIGVSLYTNEEADAVLNHKEIDFIQMPFNILDNFSLHGYVLKKAKDNNIGVHARSVFLQGLFYMDIDRVPLKLKPLINYLDQLKQIAAENGISFPEMALQYVFSNPYIDKVLVGVDTVDQLRWNMTVLKNTCISENVQQFIDSIQVEESHLLNPTNWS